MARNPSLFRLMGTSAVAAMALSAASASAQPIAPRTAQAAGGGLEEVVVTARRVEERLQTTPVAITAMGAESLQSLDITRINGLDQVMPNLVIGDAPSNGMGSIVYIRGVGAISVSAFTEVPIGIYIDGVVQARPTGNASDLPDLDRVEVLRGPQGTLFGRNTTGGAVTVYTKKPTQEAGGQAEVGYGNYNEVTASGVLNTGEIGSTGIKTKFTFRRHTYDGHIFTPGRSPGTAAGSYGATAGSFAFSKTFGDKFTIDNRIFKDRLTAKPAYQIVVANALATSIFSQSQARGGTPFVIAPGPLDIFYLDPRNTFDPIAKSWGDTLTMTYEHSDALTVKSIFGFRNLTQNQTGQLGGSVLYGPVGSLTSIQPIQFATVADLTTQDQYSEELQATGNIGEFNYVAGLYYFKELIWEDARTITGTPQATGLVTLTDGRNIYDLPSTSKAAYGNIGWKPQALDDRLEITGGLRYTQDRKRLSARRIQNTVLLGPQFASNKWTNLGWSTSASFQWTPDIMTYARYASAFRAGGYNPNQIGAPAYNPEKARTLEVGFKSEWFNRSARLNGAAFKTWYDDMQISQRNAQTATSINTNAGKATFTGAELEGTAILGGGFQLNASVGYVDAKYKEYNFLDATGAPLNIANLARFPMVSRWTYNIGGRYTTDLPVGEVTLALNYAFQSSRYFQPVDSLAPNNSTNPSGPQKDMKGTLTLAEMPWLANAGRLHDVEVQAYVNNMLNKRYRLSFVDFASYGTASWNRPRNYGVKVRAAF